MTLLSLPDRYEPLYLSALDALRSGDIHGAAEAVNRLVGDCPAFDGAWLLMSQVAQAQRDIPLAVRAATQAISRNPDSVLHYIQLGRCLVLIGKTDDTLKIIDKVTELGPKTAEEHDATASLMIACGLHEQALPHAEAAAALAPDRVAYKITAAITALMMGDMERSGRWYREVLARQPGHQGALAGLARLETATLENNLIDSLKIQLRSAAKGSEREVRVRYALAKQYEDIGDYAQSFAELSVAAAAHRCRLDYDVQRDIELVDQLIELFPEGRLETEKSGAPSPAPIFIVGMPRSGTTLVERIVSSHPAVLSAGELHDFGMAASEIAGRTGAAAYMEPAFARLLASADMRAVGERYLERTARFGLSHLHFVDKLPMNVLYAGFIRRALPNARIIELARHPLDVCLSNFKVLFRRGYEYSYDLEELGRFYLAYRRLTEHWKRVLGPNYLQVRYEDIVRDQEGESRRLIDFLGLSWHDDCLQFHKNPQPSATASAAQVRHPIYTNGVARWRNYEAELAPLIALFEAEGMQFND